MKLRLIDSECGDWTMANTGGEDTTLLRSNWSALRQVARPRVTQRLYVLTEGGGVKADCNASHTVDGHRSGYGRLTRRHLQRVTIATNRIYLPIVSLKRAA